MKILQKLSFGFLTLLGLFGCGKNLVPVPERTLDEVVIVQRQSDNSYKLIFNKKGNWKIYAGNRRKNIDWEKPVAEVENGTEAIVTDLDYNRAFFGVLTPKSKVLVASERRMYFEGAANFRDIGGLPTKDGRVVDWGKIYRSNKLSELSKKDLLYMQQLNIETVVDFRYLSEIEKDPDRLPEGVSYLKYPIGGEEGAEYNELKRQVFKKELKGEAARERFSELMGLFADSAAHDFKPVIDLLLLGEEAAPLVFHCAGGKDRTGFMSSIILAALNVDEELIKDEYLMSNFYRHKLNRKWVGLIRWVGVDTETLNYAFVVQKEYIDAVFDTIHEKYGTIDNYLEQKFGLTPEKRERLIDLYTYPEVQLETVAGN
ncbi:MAG: tyrosine-protein phosphatase [Bacteroidota bacterium]